MNIINEVEEIVKWRVTLDPATDLSGVPDGIYPFRYISDDQWCIVIGEKQIAWGREYGIICTIYVEILRIKREHSERCPGDVPFDGVAPTSAEWADDYSLQEATL